MKIKLTWRLLSVQKFAATGSKGVHFIALLLLGGCRGRGCIGGGAGAGQARESKEGKGEVRAPG